MAAVGWGSGAEPGLGYGGRESRSQRRRRCEIHGGGGSGWGGGGAWQMGQLWSAAAVPDKLGASTVMAARLFAGVLCLRYRVVANDPSMCSSIHRPHLSLIQVLQPVELTNVPEDEVLIIRFKKVLPRGEGTLMIAFQGTPNDKMHGFYRSVYELNGEKKNI